MTILSATPFALKTHSALHDVQSDAFREVRSPDMTPFATLYAPRALTDFWGNDGEIGKLIRFSLTPSPCAILLSGPTGTGKTTAATAFARSIGVNVGDTWGRGGWSEIPPGLATKEEVIKCLKELRFEPIHGSGWKVVLVNECDYMHESVLNFWLGVIDSGEAIRRDYGRTIFVFTTEDRAKMEKKRQAFVDRCTIKVDMTGDPVALQDGAQGYADAIFQAEIGTDAPTIDAEKDGLLDPFGNLSLRRVATWCEGVIRDGIVPTSPTPALPVRIVDKAPPPDFPAEPILPVSGGSPSVLSFSEPAPMDFSSISYTCHVEWHEPAPEPAPPSPDFPAEPSGEVQSFIFSTVSRRGEWKSYVATPLASIASPLRSYRVERDGSDYEVSETVSGRATCSCPDFAARHADLPYSVGCKHVQALVQLGRVVNACPVMVVAEPYPAPTVPDVALEVPVSPALETVVEPAEVAPQPPPAVFRGIPADIDRIKVRNGAIRGFYTRTPAEDDWFSKSGIRLRQSRAESLYLAGKAVAVESVAMAPVADVEDVEDELTLLRRVSEEVAAVGRLFADVKERHARILDLLERRAAIKTEPVPF